MTACNGSRLLTVEGMQMGGVRLDDVGRVGAPEEGLLKGNLLAIAGGGDCESSFEGTDTLLRGFDGRLWVLAFLALLLPPPTAWALLRLRFSGRYG